MAKDGAHTRIWKRCSLLARNLASWSASAAALALRLVRPLAEPVARLARLASLRSRVAGVVPVTTQFDGPVQTAGRPRLQFGAHCRLGRDVFFETRERGRIETGEHVRINRGCVFVSYASIRIGSHCLIGEYVSIRDADHGLEPGRLMRLQPHQAAPIAIGDDVWIARGAVILKGVTIGSGAVVGANSVVTHDVPALAIVAGIPARILRWREPAGDRTAAQPGPADHPVETGRS